MCICEKLNINLLFQGETFPSDFWQIKHYAVAQQIPSLLSYHILNYIKTYLAQPFNPAFYTLIWVLIGHLFLYYILFNKQWLFFIAYLKSYLWSRLLTSELKQQKSLTIERLEVFRGGE